MNTTQLLRRIDKYLKANSGGKSQTGETAFGRDSCGDLQVIRRIRRGAEIGRPLYCKLDTFLSERGY